jgi:hypothetical protein
MWTSFSNISDFVQEQFKKRKENPIELSKLNCWVRLASGVDNGLVLYSNPDLKLFSAAGDTNTPSIYGSSTSSGTIGVDWSGNIINVSDEQQFGYSKPNITSIEIDEGSGKGLSRKANFTITVYTEAQLNEMVKYFLEPGFTVFLEWGWNIGSSLVGYKSNLSDSGGIDYVTSNQFYQNVRNRRADTEGTYDSYLGFITGGKISLSQNFWNIEVNLTGFTELPAYLNVTDNFRKEDEGITYGLQFKNIQVIKDLGKRRFRTMFNELPSIRRTKIVKSLEDDKDAANVVNFINFDEAVRDKINSISNGWFFNLFEENVSDTNSQGENVDINLPTGTEIVGTEKFIRFKLLMKILSQFNSTYTVGKKDVTFVVNSDNVPITAFKTIFSTDKSKLFIPNPDTPKFSLAEAFGSTGDSQNFIASGSVNNSVESGNTKIIFPYNKPIVGGKVDIVGVNTKIQYTDEKDIIGFDKSEYDWGFLDDLYVNFDFANSILDTPNFSVKDALYQILNGLSSAVNGLWNFQIEEVPSSDNEGVVILKIIDLNLTPKLKKSSKEDDTIYEFDVYGYNSIFMDASFDMDIGGAMMNQIIGKRLASSGGSTSNNSSAPVTGKLFATGSIDKILTQINTSLPPVDQPDEPTEATDEDEIRQKNIELFLKKVGFYPKVDLISSTNISADTFIQTDKVLYKGIYDDRETFTSFKTVDDDEKNKTDNNQNLNVSIKLPIKFSFTVHGISGIKRGDKFSVKGIPRNYSKENGFFQVTTLKHVIENMMWKTTVEGEFRTIR